MTATETLPADEDAGAVEERLHAVLEELRPRLQADGGDMELVTVTADTVVLRLTGNCAGCGLAAVTLGGVRAKIVQALGRPVRVLPEDMARLMKVI